MEGRRHGRDHDAFHLHTEGFKDNPRRFAFLDGPLVLSAEVDTAKPLPAVLAEPGQALDSLKPVAGQPSTFTGSSDVFRFVGQDANRPVTLRAVLPDARRAALCRLLGSAHPCPVADQAGRIPGGDSPGRRNWMPALWTV